MLNIKSEDVVGWLTIGEIKNFHCPACLDGYLDMLHDVQRHWSAETKVGADEGWIEIEDYVGVFSGKMLCGKASCEQTVVVCGQVGLQRELPDGKNIYEVYKPSCFFPSPPLARVEGLSKEIQGELDRASALFWSDEKACANALRSALEIIIDVYLESMGVDKSKKLNLARKIKEAENTLQSSLTELADAVRKVGNYGSHGNQNIGQEVLVDCFNAIEGLCEEVFVDREVGRKRLMARIVNFLK